MTRKSSPGIVQSVVLLAVAAYHLIAIAQDAERCARNWNRFRAQPNPGTLAGLLIAEGVLIRDLGLGG